MARAEVDMGSQEETLHLGEYYFGHPKFEVTVPFKEEFHLASDSIIPSLLPQPHFHAICHLPFF